MSEDGIKENRHDAKECSTPWAVVAFLLIVTVSIVLFYLVKRVKDPHYALRMSEYLASGEVSSVLIECAGQAFVENEVPSLEEIEGVSSNTERKTITYRCSLRYQPLVEQTTFLPVEGNLECNGKEIPLTAGGVSKESSFWRFVYDRPRRLLRLMAQELMPESAVISQDEQDGILLFAAGGLRKEVVVPAGMIRVAVQARSQSRQDTLGEFDARARMAVYWDQDLLKETYLSSDPDVFWDAYRYARAGPHTITVSFVNDFYDEGKGWDVNLFVKEIVIDQLSGAVEMTVSDRLSLPQVRFSYVRRLDQPNKNELIRWFKKRIPGSSIYKLTREESPVERLCTDVVIGGQRRRAVFAPAPTTIRLPVQVPVDGRLFRFGFGVVPEAWGAAASAVEFRVLVQAPESSQAQLLFSQELSPQRDFRHRRWFDDSVDLGPYKGKAIELIFETRLAVDGCAGSVQGCEPYGWAVWSD